MLTSRVDGMRAYTTVAVLAVLLVSCGRGAHTSAPGPRPSTSAVAQASPSPTACAFSGKTASTETIGGGTTMLLTAVRTASQGCFDRVVFEFRPQPGTSGGPGYRVQYQTGPLYEDASGARVEMKGKVFLVVRMHPAATADLTIQGAPPSYTGPTTIEGTALSRILELRKTGDFEAVLTWAIGLDRKEPFRVSRLADPPRLVVDVG